jgi:hypothetical protein
MSEIEKRIAALEDRIAELETITTYEYGEIKAKDAWRLLTNLIYRLTRQSNQPAKQA